MVQNMQMLQNILKNYAQTIVDDVQAIINHDILITDKSGRVIAANDRLRLGTLHSHSLTVMERGITEVMNEDEASRHGIKQGVCIPIKVEDEIIGSAGITGSPKEVEKFGRFVQKEVELFVREKSLQDYSYLRESAISSLVGQILAFDQRSGNESTIRSQAEELGYDLSGDKIAVIIDISEFEKVVGDFRSQQELAGTAELNVQIFKNSVLRILRQNKDNANDIVTNITSDKFLFLMNTEGRSEAELRTYISNIAKNVDNKIKDMQISAVFGVGYVAESMGEIKDSVDNAWSALKIGKLVYPGQCIYFIEDFALENLLFSLNWPQARRYLKKTIEPLYESPFWTEDLENTLHEWLKTPFMQGEVSNRLAIHRNSLYYRLERIKQIGGMDLHNNNDVFALKIALILKSFFNSEFREALNKPTVKG